jgi:branched-chain amino acid transport system ATP-binding protein
MTAGGTLLSVRDLDVWYGAARALFTVAFEVREGEVVAIIGNNGAGKSTILKTVSGVQELNKTVHGEIEFLGRRVEHKHAHTLARMGMAHVPEGRRVFPQSSVEENLLLGGYTRRRHRAALATDLADIYLRFPVLGRRRKQPAGLLSGGEQQMLAVGRALARRPKLLLLDELSLGLAPVIVERLMPVVQRYAVDSGCGVLLVEQHVHLALEFADRAYVLAHGDIVLTENADVLRADGERLLASYMGGVAGVL